MASELGVMIADYGVLEPAMMQKVLEAHVRVLAAVAGSTRNAACNEAPSPV